MSTKLKLQKRLSSYWKMEVANVVIVPAAMIYFTFTNSSPVGWLSVFTMIPMCGLLLVGGLYWRGKYMKLKGDKSALNAALTLAHRSQTLLLILTVLACVLSISAFGFSSLSRGTGDLIVAAIAAVLAALEYVNYYHRQLQHFDHVADFKRLMSGGGFRPSQLNQDLKAWREKQGETS